MTETVMSKVLMLLSLLTWSSDTLAQNWTLYRSGVAGYRIEFPDIPESRVVSSSDGHKDFSVLVKYNDYFFTVAVWFNKSNWTNTTITPPKESIPAIVRKAGDQSLENHKIKPRERYQITNGDFKADFAVLDYKVDGRPTVACLMHTVGHYNIYRIHAEGPLSESEKLHPFYSSRVPYIMKRYLESFAIIPREIK